MTDNANSTARDLWAQMIQRATQHEYAAVEDPDYDPAADAQSFWEGMRDAGWSDAEIEARLRVHQEQRTAAAVTSPGVNPHVEFMLGKLADDVEAAMERLGIVSHARVARGVEPRCGPFASKINVVMTDESVVTVGAHLFRFCGVVARAFTRTLNTDARFWEPGDWSEAAASDLLRSRPDLLQYWARIFASYAITGTNLMVPFRPALRTEVILFEQVARAMEMFAVAHEYGHHHGDHGRTMTGDARAEEFDADQFALRIGYEAESAPVMIFNPYLASGAGGAILLIALRVLRRVTDTFRGASGSVTDTHPDADERIARFDAVAVLKPAEFAALKGFRRASVRVMTTVENLMAEVFEGVSPEDLAALRPMPFDEG